MKIERAGLGKIKIFSSNDVYPKINVCGLEMFYLLDPLGFLKMTLICLKSLFERVSHLRTDFS